MKTTIPVLACTVLSAAAQNSRLNGVVRNTAGQRISGLTLHLYQRTGETFAHRSVTTAADGTWSIELPPGLWYGAAKSDDLLGRGYFCFPGFVWCDSLNCDPQIELPPDLWGEGAIVWNPLLDPGLIDITIVPTRPDLSVEKPRTSEAGVKVTFETTAAAMTVTRQWRIEKSTDLIRWQPMQTVALSGASPVIVPDPDSASTAVCYYRAVQVEDIVAPQ